MRRIFTNLCFSCSPPSRSSGNFWSPKYGSGPQRPSLAWIGNLRFVLVSGNEISLASSSYPERLWHSRRIADPPTRGSKISVSSVLPKVAHTLDSLRKIGRRITLKRTTMNTNRISTFIYRLRPRKFWMRPRMSVNQVKKQITRYIKVKYSVKIALYSLCYILFLFSYLENRKVWYVDTAVGMEWYLNFSAHVFG